MRPHQGKAAIQMAASRRTTMRVVKDSVEGMILVYESEPPSGGIRALVFESGQSRQRVEQFPANWRTMKDQDLLALTHH